MSDIPPTPPAPPAPPAPDVVTFTQADVDRMVGGARVEAKRVAANELANELGCTVEEAKAKLEALAAAEDATKSEAQKALEAANAAKADADAARAAAAQDRFAAKVERKLIAAGVGKGLDDTKATAALTRAARLLNLDPDADDTAIAAEIEAAKADVPSLFTTEGQASTPPPGLRPPARPAGTGGAPKSLADLGREGAQRRGWVPTNAA